MPDEAVVVEVVAVPLASRLVLRVAVTVLLVAVLRAVVAVLLVLPAAVAVLLVLPAVVAVLLVLPAAVAAVAVVVAIEIHFAPVRVLRPAHRILLPIRMLFPIPLEVKLGVGLGVDRLINLRLLQPQ